MPAALPMDDDPRPSGCCSDQERIKGRWMSGDCHVSDLHHHHGMLRGLVHDGGTRPRPLVWYKNGRLSPLAACPFDLERVG